MWPDIVVIGRIPACKFRRTKTTVETPCYLGALPEYAVKSFKDIVGQPESDPITRSRTSVTLKTDRRIPAFGFFFFYKNH